MGRLYDAYVEVGPRFTGFGAIKKQGDQAGKEYGKALADAAVKAAQANARNLGAALAKARSVEADAAGKVRVAEARLNEVRANGKAKTSDITRAEEALASAQRKSASASDSAKDAAEALGKAQKRVADLADTGGKNAGGRFSRGFKGAVSKLGGDKEGKQFASRFGVGMNGAIGGIVSRSAGIFVAGFAAIKGAQVFGSFINDARESAKVGRVSAQVVLSTGGAAKITAAQMGDLATAISNKTGADDEAIQSGENLLATFTNVRNETGKGNDIFNQATQAAVDMASAMNNGVVDASGLKSANIQLGKALNDPVKGVTALSKVGVSFTQQQKDQIKTLVDSGKTLEAQKIILGEVGKEFGGAAAAASDPLTKLKTIVGNASEAIGGAFLPIVDKVATKLGTFIPDALGKAQVGLSALGQAFKGEGVTSDGFVGVMERIGVAARVAFDFFKTDVLPRLREFGGFIADTVIPAVGNLIAAFKPLAQDIGAAAVGVFQKMLPLLQQFGQFLAGTVVPAVVDFTKWLKDNSTLVGAVAVGVGAMVAAYKGYQLALTIGSAAVKAFAVVQGVLNAVMAANPIGIVVLALVGLAAGLVYAYKKSEAFRDVVNGVWSAVSGAAVTAFKAVVGAVSTAIDWIKKNWPLLLAILAGPFGLAVYAIAKHWAAIKAGAVAVFNWFVTGWAVVQTWITKPFALAKQGIDLTWAAIKGAAKTALAWVVRKFLDFAQNIIDGAAKAFGWVPGLGDKLKGASAAFKTFKDNVNRQLDGIDDEPVDIKVGLAYTQALGQATKKMKFADGGGVFGGTRGKDSVPALLMPDEHVWTTKEVAAAGGHAAMKRMRQAALAGELNGYANGGVVVHPKLPSKRRIQSLANTAEGAVDHTGDVMAKAIAKSMVFEPGGPPGARKSFRGVTLNQRTIGMLLNAERILGAMFHITQGSYSTRVAASGSTHAGGGAMDTNGPRGWNVAVAALRKAGFAAWHRTPSQGPWNHHIHSIALGDTSASPAAKAQMAAFRRGGDGLGHGMAKGGKVGSYANGSWRILRDQLALIHKDEMVLPKQAANPLRSILTSKVHQLHQNHVAHLAHVAHENHVNTTRLHPDDMRHLGRIVADELRTNPPQVHLDGRRLDQGMSRRALNGGY